MDLNSDKVRGVKDGDQCRKGQAILNTLAFFDLFDFPLTFIEIFRYTPERFTSLREFTSLLDCLEQSGEIFCNKGFYSLPGRDGILITRLKRQNYARRKTRKAHLFSRLLRLIPAVRYVAIGNLIGARNLRDESDIDLFIVVKAGRIWTVRLFSVLFAALLRSRPVAGDQKDKMCLSFFVSEEALDLCGFLLVTHKASTQDGSADFPESKVGPEHSGQRSKLLTDPYFIYWFAGMESVFDRGGFFGRLALANGWIEEELPNLRLGIKAQRLIINLRKTNKIIDLLEEVYKFLQMRAFPDQIRTAMNMDTRIVINDKALKMHVNDRRLDYFLRWTNHERFKQY